MYGIKFVFPATNLTCINLVGWITTGDHDHHLCRSRQGCAESYFKSDQEKVSHNSHADPRHLSRDFSILTGSTSIYPRVMFECPFHLEI